MVSKDVTITHEGYFDKKGNPVKLTRKQKNPRRRPIAFMLFEKCMRGDTSDNVFSAYPA